jgi:hypothetical protein
MTFVAETNTGRLRSSVQRYVTYTLISLTLGGIASLRLIVKFGARVRPLAQSKR